MKYKLMGKSGLRVSEVCLGTMTFGEEVAWGNSKKESRKVFDAFVEAGGNFIDTANYYTKGTSETYIGEFISGIREKIVLATKYSLTMNPDDPNASGNHRKNMVQSVNASLKRLKTDYIDLYWIHAWDYTTPVEEVMRSLDDLVRAGKILYVGISDAPAWVVAQANTLAQVHGWTPFIGAQLEYSLIQRTIEAEYLPMAHAFDLAITAWSPLAMGVLTGKYLQAGSKDSRFAINKEWGSSYLTNRNMKIAEAVVTLAKEIGKSPAQVALNWVRQRPGVVIPIVGAKNVDQLKDSLGCLSFDLTQSQLDRLSDASRPEPSFPHDFLNKSDIRKILLGNTPELILNHRNL